jgi:hypothetical protein
VILPDTPDALRQTAPNSPPFDSAPGRKNEVILASILPHFGPEMAQKRLKMGQNSQVQVTYQ